jgi:purine-binding chemotaxis protein CheW
LGVIRVFAAFPCALFGTLRAELRFVFCATRIARQNAMSEQANTVVKSLIVRAQAYLCALPLERVVETMRPLPVEPVAGVPPFVRGVSIIRGEPTPVIDLALLLGAPRELPWRFVTIRVGEKQVALSVGAVAGIYDLDPRVMDQLPPLLRGASAEFVESVGILDEQFLFALRSGWELPSEVWQAMTAQTQEVAS